MGHPIGLDHPIQSLSVTLSRILGLREEKGLDLPGDVNLNVIPVSVVMAIFFGVNSDLLSAILSSTWPTIVSVCLRVDLEIFLVAIVPSDTR